MQLEAAASPCNTSRERQSDLTVGDIFRTFGPTYCEAHALTPAQWKVMRAIQQCRTAALGGHLHVCTSCRYETPMYNGCRDRHCPTCGSLKQAKWIAQRQQRVLPVHYFHNVCTLPAHLRPITFANPKAIFALLLRSAADTLLELGRDPKRMGVQLGITAVLHTWTRDMKFHPHVHLIVTGGGLAVEGSSRWIHTSPDFLFPVHVMSKLFRGKFMAGLRTLYEGNKLVPPHGDSAALEPQKFQKLVDALYNADWVVYCKKPFGGADQVFRYLGRYTGRVAISNQRLIRFDDNGVCFYTKDGGTVTLAPEEFIRRFLMHVLPHGFTKIRHYGLMAPSNVNSKLQTARRLLGGEQAPDPTENKSWKEILKDLTGIDPSICPRCGQPTIERRPLPTSQDVVYPPQLQALLDTS
jgi:predicted RNA-binding Zn-ribbon protein involved in translation (DUF1610 family)